MNRLEFAIALKPADEGGFVVTCRDLPQLITQGEDVADALAQAADAMRRRGECQGFRRDHAREVGLAAADQSSPSRVLGSTAH